MKKILITPSSSGMAITTIKALSRHEEIKTYSTDIDSNSAGLHLADEGFIVPRFDEEPDYINSLLDICKTYNIDVVIPCLDPILKKFAEKKHKFEQIGTKVMISPPDTLEITQDKWKTYQALRSEVKTPKSWIRREDLPKDEDLFIKPREGSGSEGAKKVVGNKDLDFLWQETYNPIIQENLPGNEYTVDCLSNQKGKLIAHIPRKREETTDGISTKVEAIKDSELKTMAEKISKELDFTGPFFFQAKEDSRGTPRLIEIGARTAGTMCPGFSEPSLQYLGIQQVLDEEIKRPEVHYGTKMTRYWEEIYHEGRDFKKFSKDSLGSESHRK